MMGAVSATWIVIIVKLLQNNVEILLRKIATIVLWIQVIDGLTKNTDGLQYIDMIMLGYSRPVLAYFRMSY